MTSQASSHTTLISRYRPHLEALAYRMTGDHAAAQDIAQETFIKLIEQPDDSFNNSEHREAWLIRVTINRARDVLRHRKSRGYTGPWLPVPVDQEEAFFKSASGEEPSSGTQRALDALISRQGLQYGLLMVLEELTPTQRAVLLLRQLCGYTTRECAEALSLSESNIKTTLRRARAKLDGERERLWEEPDAMSVSRHGEALFELMEALMTADLERLEGLLHQDVVLTNDAGGEFIAALRPIVGRARVLRFLLARASKAGVAHPREVVVKVCNGLPCLVFELAPWHERIATRQAFVIQLDETLEHIKGMALISKRDKLVQLVS